MRNPALLFVLPAILLCAAAALPASAAETDLISVRTNMARVLRLDSPAATVIIGNPGVADITIQDPTTLVLTGKSFGRTNMIILDADGQPIADTLIEVIQAGGDTLTVYMGNARTTLSCSPVCHPMIMLGDNGAFTSDAIASSEMIESAARPN